MNVKKKLLLIGLFVILSVAIGSTIWFCNPVNKLSNEEFESYKSVYHEFSVTFLRKALDAYIENDPSKACILEPAIAKKDGKEYGMENMTTGLDAFDPEYYKSKFIVITYDDSKEFEEAKDIQIIFREKSDRIFYALVGRNPEGEICLMGFNSRDDIDPKVIKKSIKSYEPYFFDPELAI